MMKGYGWIIPALLITPMAFLSLVGQTPSATGSAFGKQVGYRLDQHIEQAKLAILPLGSVEYHGPSGPPLTDSIIAEGLASRLSEKLSASLFPVLNFTHSPAHTAAYRGTLTIRPEVVTMLLVDILRGLVKNGFQKILILNGHDGNIGPARGAISQVTQENPETQMVLISWWETLPAPEVEAMKLFTSGNGGHGHGGPLELSVASVFAPESVESGKGPDRPALEGVADFPYYLEKSDVKKWPGYSGKLSEISRQSGEKLVDLCLQKIERFVETWLEDPSHPGSW